jgi:hypothetical protein
VAYDPADFADVAKLVQTSLLLLLLLFFFLIKNKNSNAIQ